MYTADEKRYDTMKYNRCGNSGLKLSAFSLGLWHNFGSGDNYDNMVAMLTTAFDLGITHFDLANNYGPYPGSAVRKNWIPAPSRRGPRCTASVASSWPRMICSYPGAAAVR